MLSIADIRQRLIAAFMGGEALGDFEDWLSAAAFSELHQDSDPELRSYIARIMHSFDLHSDGFISDVELYSELRQLLHIGTVREARVRFTFDDEVRHESIKQADLSAGVNSQVSLVAV